MRNAVKHFQVVCSLDMPREVALVAVTEALRSVVACDWGRIAILDRDRKYRAAYAENPAFYSVGFPAWWEHADEKNTPPCLLTSALRNLECGVFLERQHLYARTSCHATSERPCDSWWMLDGLADIDGVEVAALNLLRSRYRKPFRPVDLEALRRLLPWVAYALRIRPPADFTAAGDRGENSSHLPVWLEGAAIIEADGSMRYETPSFHKLGLYLGKPSVWEDMRRSGSKPSTMPHQVRAVLKNLRSLDPAASPPFGKVTTPYGAITIEATLLAATDQQSVDAIDSSRERPALVRLSLRKHPAMHVAGELRKAGASPTQTAVGTRIVMGSSKKAIAADLGVDRSSVEDAARKLYQRLDVHNAAQLGHRIWAE